VQGIKPETHQYPKSIALSTIFSKKTNCYLVGSGTQLEFPDFDEKAIIIKTSFLAPECLFNHTGCSDTIQELLL
jgi:hypothetical protein